MSDQRLTELTELTTPADGDFLYVVDVSDTSGSPAGTSKKLQNKNARGYPQTSAESTAGVTPTNYEYEPGNVLRYGATGDGVTDDTTEIENAISSNSTIYVPSGTYIVSSELVLTSSKTIYGDGAASIIKNSGTTVNVLAVTGRRNKVDNLTLQGGNIGLAMRGSDASCVNNAISNLWLIDNQYGIDLDGFDNASKPCYWNFFNSIAIRDFYTSAIRLRKSSTGDTPNNNWFESVQAKTSRAGALFGIDLVDGRFQNAFVNCHVALTSSGTSCVKVRTGVTDTVFVNLYTESSGGSVVNVTLDSGSQTTSIINLFSASGGAAISDGTGGDYYAFNAGGTDRNKMDVALANTMKVGKLSITYQEADPPQATYRSQTYSNAMPSTGSYVRGDIVWNSSTSIDVNNMVVLGWSRLVTGSNHVSGTDWATIRVSDVSPAT